MESNQLLVDLRVVGIVREEEGLWIAGFPRLEVYSQGATPEEAKAAASEALNLWVRSCLDRGTLDEALKELGWHALSNEQDDGHSADSVSMYSLEKAPQGEPWEGHVAVPAYQASAFLNAEA